MDAWQSLRTSGRRSLSPVALTIQPSLVSSFSANTRFRVFRFVRFNLKLAKQLFSIFLGTYGYMPCEVSADDYDPFAADVFGLGATLIDMLALFDQDATRSKTFINFRAQLTKEKGPLTSRAVAELMGLIGIDGAVHTTTAIKMTAADPTERITVEEAKKLFTMEVRDERPENAPSPSAGVELSNAATEHRRRSDVRATFQEALEKLNESDLDELQAFMKSRLAVRK